MPIDVTSLEAAGLGAELPAQLRDGAAALDQVAGVSPDPRMMLVAPVDDAALARMRGLLVEQVVVPSTSLGGEQPEQLLAPFTLQSGDATFAAVATNAQYEALISSEGSAALRAQRLLAALSVLTFERDTPVGVVLGTPGGWAPDVPTVRAVLAGLTSNPLHPPGHARRTVRVGARGHRRRRRTGDAQPRRPCS